MGKAVKSFTDIASLFDDEFHIEFAAWYSLREKDIRDRYGRSFSYKEGTRPVVVISIHGPNIVAFPRSASRSDGCTHSAHQHGRKCAINKDGWVVDDCPFTLAVGLFTREEFSCREPDSSPLRPILERGGRR